MDESAKDTAEVSVQDAFTVKAQAFIKEYGDLVAKHGIDFATYPVFVPDGAGGFKILVQNTPIDISKQPKKSPAEFVAKE